MILQQEHESLAQAKAFIVEDWLDVRKSQSWYSALVHAYNWTFDGRFRKSHERIPLNDLPSLEESFNIQELSLCPMRFASEDVIEALRKRGRMFWKCRFKNYVSLHTELDNDMQNSVRSYFSFVIHLWGRGHSCSHLDEFSIHGRHCHS